MATPREEQCTLTQVLFITVALVWFVYIWNTKIHDQLLIPVLNEYQM